VLEKDGDAGAALSVLDEASGQLWLGAPMSLIRELTERSRALQLKFLAEIIVLRESAELRQAVEPLVFNDFFFLAWYQRPIIFDSPH